MPPKYSPMPPTYVSAVTNEQAGPPTASPSFVYSQDAIDLRDLLTLPTHPATELVVPSKLKALCTNHSMKGLLEVTSWYYRETYYLSTRFIIKIMIWYRSSRFTLLVMLPLMVPRWRKLTHARVQLISVLLLMIARLQTATVYPRPKLFITLT